MPETPLYRFSITELLAIITITAIALAWPVMLPLVLTMILIRVGLGLFQALAAALLLGAVALYFLV